LIAFAYNKATIQQFLQLFDSFDAKIIRSEGRLEIESLFRSKINNRHIDRQIPDSETTVS